MSDESTQPTTEQLLAAMREQERGLMADMYGLQEEQLLLTRRIKEHAELLNQVRQRIHEITTAAEQPE